MGVEANQRIGDYEVLGVLGAGGMGKVYRVRNVISDRVEAMKVLLPDLAGRQELATRFLREIKLLASLNHPNIATLCTALTIDNQLVMIMEFVEGVTLDQMLDQGRISVGDATEYIGQALAALSYAHGKGVVHRDIKPANMMLTGSGIVKVMDFGIARSASERSMTQTGTTLGSVNYMSPEQITGQAVDARSDIYSVGITLYELVTGQRPFDAHSDYELMAMHVKEVPRAPIELQPWLPADLNHIILTAIAKDPSQRFQSAEEFRQTLLSTQGQIQQGQYVTPVRPGTMMEVPSYSAASHGTQATPTSGYQPVARPGTMVAAPARPATMVAGMPQYQNVALANQPPAVNPRRKVYIAGGAFLAFAALGAPAMYMVKHHSASTTTPATTTSQPAPAVAAPAPATAQTPPPGAPPATSAPAPSTIPPAGASATAKVQMPGQPSAASLALQAKLHPGPALPTAKGTIIVQQPVGPAHQPYAGAQQGPPPMTAELQDRLDHLELRVDQDTSQASSINNSLNTMQSQMQRDGMSLRGDVSAQQASMNLNMRKAQEAFATHDAERGERFANLAEADIAQLKKFLGR